jgi:hypothetical protein
VNTHCHGNWRACGRKKGGAWAATVASTAFLLGAAHAHEFSKPVLLAGTVLAVVIVVAVAMTIRRQEGRLQLEADKAFGTDRS